jgi:hypothetical protein
MIDSAVSEEPFKAFGPLAILGPFDGPNSFWMPQFFLDAPILFG